MRVPTGGLFVLALGLLLPSLPAAAQTLRQVAEAAWRSNPETALEASGQAEAAARRDNAGRWLAAPPSLTVAERSDRFDADLGRRTQELELELPLWRWGQRSANSALAGADHELATADLALARWKLAGEVREVAWTAALDESAADFARQRLQVVERIEREVGRHVEVGDLARADWLLINGEKLAAQAATLDAERRAQESLLRYRVLIGEPRIALPTDLGASLPVAPAESAESANAANPTDVTTMPPAHPLLVRATAERTRAQRAGEAAAQNDNEPLELSLGVERERDTVNSPTSATLRLALKIPFGGGAWNRPAQAAAGATRSRAELQESAARRAVGAEIANARVARGQAESALALAAQRVAAADEHARLLRKGFALGETGLAALLRGESLLLEAQSDAAKQKLLLGQAQSRFEHSLGMLP